MSGPMCIQCALRRGLGQVRPQKLRRFHTRTSLQQNSRKPEQSVVPQQQDQGVMTRDITSADIKPYTQEEKARLAKVYTPAQMAVIEAGEAAVDTEDLYEQGALREDAWVLPYRTDDLSQILPVVDHRPPVPDENIDMKQRLKTKDEIAMDLADFIMKQPEDSSPVEMRRFMDTMRYTVGKEEAERNPPTFEAPAIPNDIPALRAGMQNAGEKQTVTPAMKRFVQQTGLDLKTIRSLKTKVLVRKRVVNQTKMGKISSTYNLAIAGDGNGLLGVGEGKSTEGPEARRQATYNAIRLMKPIPRYEDRTIYGDIKIKVGAVELELMNRPPGFGVRCQSLIYEMCQAAGIYDLAARVTRSRNPMNVVKTVYKALMNQRLPEDVARGLGKKLVDVRKVYYSGNV